MTKTEEIEQRGKEQFGAAVAADGPGGLGADSGHPSLARRDAKPHRQPAPDAGDDPLHPLVEARTGPTVPQGLRGVLRASGAANERPLCGRSD